MPSADTIDAHNKVAHQYAIRLRIALKKRGFDLNTKASAELKAVIDEMQAGPFTHTRQEPR